MITFPKDCNCYNLVTKYSCALFLMHSLPPPSPIRPALINIIITIWLIILSLATICSNVNNKFIIQSITMLIINLPDRLSGNSSEFNILTGAIYIEWDLFTYYPIILEYYILCFVHDREKMSFKCITIWDTTYS